MKKVLRKLSAVLFAAACGIITTLPASAASGSGNLSSSIAVTGTQNLLADLSNILLIIAPIVGTACIVYFAIRHGAADEMDQKKWKQRIIVAAVSIVVAVVASALINVLVSYYQP